jgi:hypothetical protein
LVTGSTCINLAVVTLVPRDKRNIA